MNEQEVENLETNLAIEETKTYEENLAKEQQEEKELILNCAIRSLDGTLDYASNGSGIAQTLARLYKAILHTNNNSKLANENVLVRLYLYKLLDLNGMCTMEYYGAEEDIENAKDEVRELYNLHDVKYLF